MDRAQTQSIIGQLRDEIRRREAALPAGSLGVLASGFAPLDALLPGGGFPRGRVVELVGSRASGKTTLALSALARASAEGQLVAYVDPAGELYPPAAQGLGADLTRLLIVRPREAALGLRVASLLARSKAFAAVAIDLPAVAKGPLGPLSRRLLEAAETGRAAIILLCDGPSGLDTSLRLSVERLSPTELALAVERSRLGPPGRAERGALASPEAPDEQTPDAEAARVRRLLRGQPAANE